MAKNVGLGGSFPCRCEVLVEFFGEAGGKGDAELPRQCAELYGLFQRKNIMEAPTDATLRVNVGKPKGLANLEDDKAPGGLFIQHTASHQWYHCFILGKKVGRAAIGARLHRISSDLRAKCLEEEAQLQRGAHVGCPASEPRCVAMEPDELFKAKRICGAQAPPGQGNKTVSLLGMLTCFHI